jgi:hypothetical protein
LATLPAVVVVEPGANLFTGALEKAAIIAAGSAAPMAATLSVSLAAPAAEAAAFALPSTTLIGPLPSIFAAAKTVAMPVVTVAHRDTPLLCFAHSARPIRALR